ncbi:unnamed protein product [marine sediment metagenome]|uniref:Uncharacterized protein n=1 Tax=marine sediment metagenome TaxID=412755 RepID=X1RBT4_9ZZZZ
MLADAWLKVVGAFTPDDMKLLKAQGCASGLFDFLEAFEELFLAWRRTEQSINKAVLTDVRDRLDELRAALREG